MWQQKRRRLLNVVTASRAIGFRRRDGIVGKWKLIGRGPEVGELAFAGGRLDVALGAAVTTQVGTLGVGAVTAVADIRAVRAAVNVHVLFEGAR